MQACARCKALDGNFTIWPIVARLSPPERPRCSRIGRALHYRLRAYVGAIRTDGRGCRELLRAVVWLGHGTSCHAVEHAGVARRGGNNAAVSDGGIFQ